MENEFEFTAEVEKYVEPFEEVAQEAAEAPSDELTMPGIAPYVFDFSAWKPIADAAISALTESGLSEPDVLAGYGHSRIIVTDANRAEMEAYGEYWATHSAANPDLPAPWEVYNLDYLFF